MSENRRYYSSVTSSADSWGMCCDEETARDCEREWYQRKWAEEDKTKALLKGIALGVVSVCAFFGICLFCILFAA